MTSTSGTVRALVATLVALSAVLLAAPPASAHARVVGSDPADGSTVDASPVRVTVTFSEDLPADYSSLTVVGPDRRGYDDGDIQVSGSELSTGLEPLGPAGTYVITWSVVSEDGHPVEGELRFDLSTAGVGEGHSVSGNGADAAVDQQGNRLGWIAGGVLGIAVAITAGLVVARRLGG